MADETDAAPVPNVVVLTVSLAAAAARRVRMQTQFDRLGMAGYFVDGFDARDPAAAQALRDFRDRGPWGALHIHDKACSASHFKALRRFLETAARCALILEDDVFLAAELPLWIADLSWLPPDADLVKFESWRDPRLKVLLAEPAQRHAGRRIARLLSRHSGGAGYLVTRAAARRILAHRPLDLPIDHLLFNPNASPLAATFTSYQVAPALVVQGNDPPPAGAPTRNLPPPPENRALRELRRARYEIRLLHKQMWHLLTARARLSTITWQSTATE